MLTTNTDTKQAPGEKPSGHPNKETEEAIEELESGRGLHCKNLKDLYRELDENN